MANPPEPKRLPRNATPPPPAPSTSASNDTGTSTTRSSRSWLDGGVDSSEGAGMVGTSGAESAASHAMPDPPPRENSSTSSTKPRASSIPKTNLYSQSGNARDTIHPEGDVRERVAPNSTGLCGTEDKTAPVREDPSYTLAVEVGRILAVNKNEPRLILGFVSGNAISIPLVKTRYRKLMAVLHPDKRTPDGEHKAGGKDNCERAFQRVQEASRALEQNLQGSARSRCVSTPVSQGFQHGYPRPSQPSAQPHPKAAAPPASSTIHRPPARHLQRPPPPPDPPPSDDRACIPLDRPAHPFGVRRVMVA